MSRLNTFLLFALVAGCSEHGTTPPPWGVPITGGTMLVTRDGTHAVVADPDRDRIVSVELATGIVKTDLALTAGDEPGRLIEDGAGRIHVALRRAGALLTFSDAASLTQVDRRYACAEPRGLAWDSASNSVYVACTGGELIAFPAGGGVETRRLFLDRDLRDIIVQGNQLFVTRFKTAQLLTVDLATGAVTTRLTPPDVQRFDGGFEGPVDGTGMVPAVASIAWRTIALPDGRMIMSHQRQVRGKLDTNPGQQGGYGTGCGEGPVEIATTVVAPGAASATAIHALGRGALPVDIAASATGDRLALVVAGGHTVKVVDSVALTTPDQDDCEPPDDDDQGEDDLGAPTSVAFAPNGDLVIFYPELPGLVVRANAGVLARTIELPGGIGYDAGRAVFHRQTTIGLACGSCHPEGREDGLVWDFSTLGLRRTQSLAGGILARAPYHWSGDERDLPTLMDDVFSERMSGGTLTDLQKASLGPWLDRIAAPAPVVVDPASAERGRAIFESLDTGCTTCHGGALMTTNTMANVGKGGTFKAPSLLGLAYRAPYMHDGSVPTLAERFGPLGGGDLHGHTSQLTPEQITDLVAYLESL